MKQTDEAIILKDDGISEFKKDDFSYLPVHENIKQARKHVVTAWASRILESEDYCVTVICQNETEGNRRHYHSKIDETWVIVSGSFMFELEDKKVIVQPGDIVIAKRNQKHKITALQNGSVRVAISKNKAEHIYED